MCLVNRRGKSELWWATCLLHRPPLDTADKFKVISKGLTLYIEFPHPKPFHALDPVDLKYRLNVEKKETKWNQDGGLFSDISAAAE